MQTISREFGCSFSTDERNSVETRLSCSLLNKRSVSLYFLLGHKKKQKKVCIRPPKESIDYRERVVVGWHEALTEERTGTT